MASLFPFASVNIFLITPFQVSKTSNVLMFTHDNLCEISVLPGNLWRPDDNARSKDRRTALFTITTAILRKDVGSHGHGA
jgi:hypothetical protein